MESHLSEKWYKLIKSGEKKGEGRVLTGKWENVQEGDVITWYPSSEKKKEKSKKKGGFRTKVVGVHLYNNFSELLAEEGVENILPGYTLEKGIEVYDEIYKDQVFNQVIAILLELMK